MSWYLLPSGQPRWAIDGSSFAGVLIRRGATVLDEDDVPAAITAWHAHVAGPPGNPADFVTDAELAQAIADVGTLQGPPGQSAYELAVSLGYGGTLETWLASLEGPPGAGTPGADGEPGAPGLDGAPGEDGAPGQVTVYPDEDGHPVFDPVGIPELATANTDELVAEQIADTTSETRATLDNLFAPLPLPDPLDVDAIAAAAINEPGSDTRIAGDGRWIVKGNRPVNLRDVPGIDFTEATDSYAALQGALDAADPGTVFEFGRPGRIRCDTGLTHKLFQQLEGPAYYPGTGGTPPASIRFPNLTGSQAAITGGGGGGLRNILIKGPMTGAEGTIGYNSPSGSPIFENVQFYGFAIGHKLTNAYYSRFIGCEWMYNRYAGIHSGCYNLFFQNPKAYCRYGASVDQLGRGFSGAARGMTVEGGAIEGYGAGGVFALSSGDTLNVDGLYMESNNVAETSNAWGIIGTGLNQVTINLRGMMVYLRDHSRFVDLSGATNALIHSEGNTFVCDNASATAPVAYYLNPADVTTGNVRGRIGRDRWDEVTKTGAQYLGLGVFNLGQIPDLDIRHPSRKYLGGDAAGNGSPEGVVPGPVGARYRRLDGGPGTASYTKESGTGTTGWVAK